MSPALAKSDFLASLTSHAAALGLRVRDQGADGLTGEVDSIRAKWFLGGRKVSYRMSCRLVDAEHAVRFRDAVTESTWGIPPPTLTVEKTMVKGAARAGARTDRSQGGGGTIDSARVREELRALATAAGWQFHLEGVPMP